VWLVKFFFACYSGGHRTHHLEQISRKTEKVVSYLFLFSKMVKPKAINSWKGFETQKEKLTSLAFNYKKADAVLETKAGGNGAFEYTVRGSSGPNIPEGIEANLAFDELVKYHKYLVLELGLDYFMVRNIWDRILGNSQ
jgi:hypothetical protein